MCKYDTWLTLKICFLGEDYEDLYTATVGSDCYCSAVEPSDMSLLTSKCDTNCPGQSNTKCGHTSSNDDEVAISVYRANTVCKFQACIVIIRWLISHIYVEKIFGVHKLFQIEYLDSRKIVKWLEIASQRAKKRENCVVSQLYSVKM